MLAGWQRGCGWAAMESLFCYGANLKKGSDYLKASHSKVRSEIVWVNVGCNETDEYQQK